MIYKVGTDSVRMTQDSQCGECCHVHVLTLTLGKSQAQNANKSGTTLLWACGRLFPADLHACSAKSQHLSRHMNLWWHSLLTSTVKGLNSVNLYAFICLCETMMWAYLTSVVFPPGWLSSSTSCCRCTCLTRVNTDGLLERQQWNNKPLKFYPHAP